MALSYEEALSTLQSMFSDQGYTPAQLDAVLRHHGGHMENTVETLLSHGGGSPESLIEKLPGLPADGAAGGGGAAPNVDADEELARQLAAEDGRGRAGRQSRNQRTPMGMGRASLMGMGGGIGRNANAPPPGPRPAPSSLAAPDPPAPAGPPAATRGMGTPTTLPPDFLRVPGQNHPAASNAPPAAGSSNDHPIVSASGPGGMSQMMSDEQLARMLQDKLFQEELRSNPEFSHLAGRRNPRAGGGAGGYPGATGRSTYGGAGGAAPRGGQTDFMAQLSELGDTTRRRFRAWVEQWNEARAEAAAQQGGTGRRPLFVGLGGQNSGAASGAGNERRGLLSDDLGMEEEMDFVRGRGDGSGGRDFEMNAMGNSSGGGGGGGGIGDWSLDKKKD